MDETLTPYIKIVQKDVPPNLPQLRLTLSASKDMSLTLPFSVHFSIAHQDPLSAKTIIFEWSLHNHGFLSPGLVLLRHTEDSLKLIAIDHSGLVDTSRHGPCLVNGWNQGLWELSPDGAVKLQAYLPERYQKRLKARETYTLLWPGSEIALWETGTIYEHIGSKLDDRPNPIILPGGPHITFSTYTEPQPWPEREEHVARVGFDRANRLEQEWRFAQSRPKVIFPPANKEYDPCAPILRVSLACASSLRSDKTLEVNVKVTYEAEATTRPITFRTFIFEDYNNYQLGWLLDGIWDTLDNESIVCGGFLLADDPDLPVTVG